MVPAIILLKSYLGTKLTAKAPPIYEKFNLLNFLNFLSFEIESETFGLRLGLHQIDHTDSEQRRFELFGCGRNVWNPNFGVRLILLA